jgi:hypothetical protein
LARGLEIEARLVVSYNDDQVQIAGTGNYLIVNFPSQRVLDAATSGPPGPKKPKPPGFDPLQQLHDLARELGLVLELLQSKIGSFFRGS